MSDISLRDYLARLDQLSQAGSADEVLWHARHVLQFYPKNVDAYRFIGRALVALGRWDEANATLRRVLSVLPDDKTAHLLLSTSHERQNRPDEAIWHLERAFERDPNDTYLLDELKRLYKDHRGVANPRIQLTTAAVARQNIRSRDFDRAIESLRATLKRSPQRADLRLLLADALWQKGSKIDAAETALDVLQSFPDCLDANNILATLWLSEQRPSDARRHLNRIEAVDPYLALELVQGHSVDKNNFVLPELDYQRQAQAAMVGAQPDWLDNIDLQTRSESEDITSSETSDRFEDIFAGYTPEVAEAAVSASLSESTESEAEWLSELDSIEMSYQLNTSALQATTSPLAPAAEDEGFIEGDLPNFSVPANSSEEVFAFDWAEDEILNDETVSEPVELVNDDPLAWLRSSGIEVTDNPPQSASLLEATEDIVYDDPEIAAEEDPLNWLKDYGTEVTNAWEKEASQTPVVDDLSIRSTEEVDAIDKDIEEDFPMPDLDTIVDDWSVQPSSEDKWSGVRAPQTMPLRPQQTIVPEEMANPLDEWEMNERLLNESLGLEALNDATPGTQAPEASFLDEDDFSAIIDAVPHAPPTAPLPPMSDEDWDAIDRAMTTASLSSEDMIMSDTKNPDFEHDEETPKAVEEEVGSATDMLDWLGTITEGDVPAEAATPTPEAATGSTGMLSWLAQGENPAYDVTPEQISTSEEPTGSTGILNWLSQNRPVPPTVPLGQANVEPEFSAEDLNIPDSPDWLQDLVDTPQPALSPSQGAGATDMLEWLDDAEVPPGTSTLPHALSGEEVLPPDTDWLNTVYQEVQLQQPPAQATEELVWDEEATFEEELAAETPMGEWLATDVLPDLPLTEPLGSETAPFNQTDSFVTAQLETAPAPGDESFAALADWLQTSDLPEDESISFDPLAEEQSAEEMPIEEELEIAEPAFEVEFENAEEVMMDEGARVMLENSSLDDGEEEFVTSLLDTGETQTLPTWMTDVTGEATTAEAFAAEPLNAVSDDALDWLDSAAPVGAIGVVAAALASEPSAEDEVQPLAEEPVDVLEPAHEDWGLDSDSLESIEVEDAEAEQLFEAELTTANAEETEEAIAEIEEPEVVEDNTYYSAFEDLPAAEMEAVENGSNAPDWLNAMVPGLDIDTTAGAQGITDLLDDDMTDETADAAAMPEDYQWLNEMVEEETQSDIIVPAVASQSPRFVFSRPPRWLRRLLERRAEGVDATDNSDLPAWLR